MSFVALVFCVGLEQRRGCVAYVAFGQIASNVPAVVSAHDAFVRDLVGGLFCRPLVVHGFFLDALLRAWNGFQMVQTTCLRPLWFWQGTRAFRELCSN